jgi:hypothetical protein
MVHGRLGVKARMTPAHCLRRGPGGATAAFRTAAGKIGVRTAPTRAPPRQTRPPGHGGRIVDVSVIRFSRRQCEGALPCDRRNAPTITSAHR